jgi:ligand-binding sensor domain-containing protein/serine phosphatase RsbU (regulator of sigma subunit)
LKRRSSYIYVLVVILLGSCARKEKPKEAEPEKSIVIETQGLAVGSDSIEFPVSNPAKAPNLVSLSEGTAIPYENNIHPAKQPVIVAFGENFMKEHEVPITLPPKVTVAVSRTVHCSLTEPKPSSEMRFKDNANFNIQYMDVAQGFPHSYVTEMFEDKSGNIWFCCKGIITRYNGRSFVNFSEKNELLRTHIKFKSDKEGNIWMATRNGLIQYNGKILTVYDTLGGLPDNEVSAIEIDKNGNIWIGTPKGLTRFDGNKFYTYSKEHGIDCGKINTIVFDSSEQLWFGSTGAGAFCFRTNSFIKIGKTEGLPGDLVEDMAADKSGNIWLCGDGMIKISKSGLEIFKQEQGLINNNARNIIVDRNNNVWCSAYRGGMSCFDGKNFTWYTDKEGLSTGTVDCLLEDHNGNIWAGTDGSGVNKLTPKSFNHFIPARGFNPIVMSVCEDDKKNIWLGSYDEGLFKYDGSKILAMQDKTRNLRSVVFMLKDKTGALWMNSGFGGLLKYDGNKFVHYTKEHGLFTDAISTIMEDRQGNIWIGTHDHGAVKFDGNKFTRYNTEQGLLDNAVRYMANDKKGNIWIATARGLNKWTEGSVTFFTDSNGLSNINIKNLMVDRNDNLWIGTVGGGLNKYDGKYMMKLSKEEGLSNKIVRSVIEDKEWNVRSGYTGVWVSTDDGINHVIVKNGSSSIKDVQIIAYGRQDGLRGEDFTSNSGFMDSKGRAWWGSVKGLTSLQTNDLKTDVDTPRITLDYISLEQNYIDFNALEDSIANGKKWVIGERDKRDLTSISFSGIKAFGNYPLDLKLPYNINNITFNYSANSWLGGHKIKYQYVLEGSDKEWHPETAETRAIYTSLSPGTYTFKVKAKGASDKWSQPLEYTFTVKPPWWRTVWAYAIYAVVFLAAAVMYMNYRTRALLNRQKELEQIIVERTADVVEEKNKVEEKSKIIGQKQKEILDSIQYAENIQKTLLANHDFVNQTIPDSFVFFRPKDIVSGDFYWATSAEGKFYLAVCDSTGHGVPGAFMSLLNISFLNEAINEKHIYEPNKVFDHVRQRLIDNISQGGRKDGMDGILICIDTITKSISYSASNNAPVLVSGSHLQELPFDKMPIGESDRRESFKKYEITYKNGDMLYLFTDGYADQFGGPKGKKFKYKKLNELLVSVSQLTLKEQKTEMEKAFESWKGELEQVDDVCVLGIRL